MKYLDLTLPLPEENLACDEALLDECERGIGGEILRVWESKQQFVVLGHGCKAGAEVNIDVCRKQNVPVLRRESGGGTVLQGPGCLNYALVLRMESADTISISSTNQFVMNRHRDMLRRIGFPEAEVSGITDIAIKGLKVSGNAQRRKQHALLFHGTFLLDFEVRKISELLREPERQPDYRGKRLHAEFITNLHFDSATLKGALRETWNARDELLEIPGARIRSLVAERYSRNEWNFKFS